MKSAVDRVLLCDKSYTVIFSFNNVSVLILFFFFDKYTQLVLNIFFVEPFNISIKRVLFLLTHNH